MATSNLSLAQGAAKQLDSMPTRKVMLGGLAGAVSIIIVFLLNTYAMPTDKPLPSEVASAITTILSFVVAYLVPPAASDQVTAA